MAIDTGIYANLLRPPKSVAEYDQEAQASQLNALQLQNGRMKQDEYQRGIADQNALRDATRGFGADTTANYNALLRTGNMKAAQEYQKGNTDLDLTRAKTKQEGVQTQGMVQDQAIKAHAQALQQLPMVGDPQQLAQWMQAQRQAGVFDDAMFERGMQAVQGVRDPQSLEALKQKIAMGGVTALEQMKLKFQAEKQAEEVRQFGVTSTETNRANVSREGLTARGQNMTQSTAMRGQNMVDARSKESTAATMSKPFEITGPDGKPVLVQQDKQGNIKPVEGYAPKTGADKPMTDAQAKAALFGSRMESSNKILETLAGSGTDVSIPGSRTSLIGPAINAMSPAKNQQLDQAKRDFINATLRRESGAVISDGEFDNADKQYFPQVGDSKEVKAQKAQNRAIAVRGVQAEVPKGNRGVLAEIQGTAPGGFDAEKERRYQEWKAKQK